MQKYKKGGKYNSNCMILLNLGIILGLSIWLLLKYSDISDN